MSVRKPSFLSHWNDLDRIQIRDLTVLCIVGDLPEERTRKRRVILNIDLLTPVSSLNDDLSKTVDYAAVCEEVRRVVGKSRYQLIESLAECVVQTCLGFSGVKAVRVTLDKPGAIRGCRSVAVTLTRSAR